MPVRRKSRVDVSFPDNWEISDTYDISPTQTIQKGSLCKVKKERGVFRFFRHVVATSDTGEKSEWVTLYGGTGGQEQWRSVRPELLTIPKNQAPPRPKKKRAKQKNSTKK